MAWARCARNDGNVEDALAKGKIVEAVYEAPLALLKPDWEVGEAGKTDSAQFAKLYRDTLDGAMVSGSNSTIPSWSLPSGSGAPRRRRRMRT